MSNEQSIRDELARDLNLAYDLATGMAATDEQFIPCADWLLGDSPVIRRIQAEALREAAGKVQHELGTEASGHTSTYSARRWLNFEADRIERGETA